MHQTETSGNQQSVVKTKTLRNCSTMKLPFINSRNTGRETEVPWDALLAEHIREDVADLRRIADEVDDDHAEELRAIADNYELMAETHD